MTTIWRIHGEDQFGTFAIDCYDHDEYVECWNRLRDDSKVEGGLWLEMYDDEEGWQA